MFVKKYQKVIKTYLPTYLLDSSDGNDSSDISDSSDSSDSSNRKFGDKKNFATKILGLKLCDLNFVTTILWLKLATKIVRLKFSD